VTELKYKNEIAVGATKDPEDVSIKGYYEIGEFRYALKVDIKIAIESESVVGIKTLLNIISIAL